MQFLVFHFIGFVDVGGATALHAAVSGSIPGRVEIFNKRFLPVTRRDGEAEPQSLVSVPNIN